MHTKNQNAQIKEIITGLLDGTIKEGVHMDKQELYTKVVQQTGYPRPTVRRVAAELRNDLLEKIKILQSEAQQTTVPTV